ncbi:hypothetical protein ALC60_06666 [Trachymyrmex zeteki]|uniref:Uncharacterized protein n=1 Tax=Mycetomoellerius zeteki TaxID=64791 RepID=A0A151X2A1_9HYME|nr:hypothetical protein ALC60_06666 [Trachymyrmex zeteki]
MSNDATRNENVDPAGIRAINPRVELQATLLFNGPSERGVNARGIRVGGGGGGDGGGGGGTQREITLHPIRFKAGMAIPRRKSPP